MANDPGNDRSKDIEGPQDAVVAQRRPDPSQPPMTGLTLNGFLGDSDRAGQRRLYFTINLDYYIEFAIADVVQTSQIPAEQPPFVGAEATQILLKKDANVAYTRTSKVRPPDEFDLDIQTMPAGTLLSLPHVFTTFPAATCHCISRTCHFPCPSHVDACSGTCEISALNSPQCGPSQIQGACCTPGQPSDGANR